MGKGNKKGTKTAATMAPVVTAPETATDTNVQTDTAVVGTTDNAGTTDNIVQNADNGTPSGDGSQAAAPAAEKKKRVPMSRVMIGGVLAKITADVKSVKDYVMGFMALPVGAKKGYDNYWAKEDGFTNPEAIMKLTPQGIGKIVAIRQHRAALLISEGGESAAEMTAVLDGLRQYETVAITEAKNVAQNTLIEQARETLRKTGATEAAIDAALAGLAGFVPVHPTAAPASIEADAPTLGESGGAIGDNADETADNEAETADA